MNKDTTEKIFGSHLDELLPFMLTVILGSAMYSVYNIPVFSGWTAGTVAVSAAFFLLCRFIDRHHIIGGVIFAVVFVMMFRLFAGFVFAVDYGAGFQEWFLTGAERRTTRFEYLMALLVSFVPFFAVVTYYFTKVLYRMFFLTLVSLIPCALYVKVLSEIDNVYVALIAMLNVAIFMFVRRKEGNRGRIVAGKRSALFAGGTFTFLLLIFSAAVPKENEARYYDRFEELFMNSGNRTLSGNYSFFSEFSGGANAFRNFLDRRMYSVYGKDAPYFKRQTFDFYNFETNRWYKDKRYSEPYYTIEQWQEQNSKLSLSQLQQAIRTADKYSRGFAEKYGLKSLIDYSDINDPLTMVTVAPVDFEAVYYLSPARVVGISPPPSDPVYVTRGGVMCSADRPHSRNYTYSVWFYDELLPRFYWFELGGADMDNETCGQMLNELVRILEDNGDELSETAKAYLTVHNDAAEYREMCAENNESISGEIHTLAEEITAGMKYDWEKADALQRYFMKADFVYDLNFYAADESMEYFLFESKRGSCSDFAAAFVLMARSLGLTVRYAEGYTADVTSRENIFAIKDSNAHAYPEVYIQNMGWIVFEPTIPSEYTRTVQETQNAALEVDYGLIYVICVISGIILAAALAAVISVPVISERIFMSRLHGAAPTDSALMAYKRISSKKAAKIIKHTKAFTPSELALKLEELTGFDMSGLAYIVESTAYGKKEAGEADKTMIIGQYTGICKAVKASLSEKNKNRKAEKKYER